MASVEKLPMLAEGYEKLNAELKALREERPLIVDAIEEARAHGDLSENAEYHAAKERQGQVEATISDLEDKISRAQIIDPTTLSGDRIVFGIGYKLQGDGVTGDGELEGNEEAVSSYSDAVVIDQARFAVMIYRNILMTGILSAWHGLSTTGRTERLIRSLNTV
jgi:hypothetical protein